jgi:PAS domain S-box-containing protein
MDALDRLRIASMQVAEAETVVDVARAYVEGAAEALETWFAGLWFKSGAFLEWAHGAGASSSSTPYTRIPLDGPEPICAAAKTGEPVWLANAAEYQARFSESFRQLAGNVAHVTDAPAAALRRADLALAAIPLRAGDEIVGVLLLVFMGRHAFIGSERSFVLALAHQCAYAIDRLRLLDRERAQRRRMERLQELAQHLSLALAVPEVAHVVVDDGVSALDAKNGAVWLVDNDECVLVADRNYTEVERARFARLPLAPPETLARAVRDEATVWIDDATVCLPLSVGGKYIGCLGFGFADRRQGNDEHELLLLFARDAAQAFERARLHDAEQHVRRTLEAAFEASPAAMVVLDDDGTVRSWNEAAEKTFGWRRDEVIGRRYPSVPGTEAAEKQFLELLANISAGESVAGLELVRQKKDGSAFDAELFAAPVSRGGGSVQLVSVIVDVTERKREAVRQRFLAEAGAALADALDVNTMLERVARLSVAEFAEWCFIDLIADDGWLDRVAVAHADPKKSDIARAMRRRLAPKPNAAYGVSRVVARSEPELVEVGNPEIISILARDPAHKAALEGLETKSYVIAPLAVAGRSIGALTFTTSLRSYDKRDLSFALELARRVALAVDNRRLSEARQHTLQRLTDLQMLTSELSNARTPADVASVAARRGPRALGATSCTIEWLVDESIAKIASREPQFVEGEAAYCTLPLADGDRIFGVIRATYDGSYHQFSDEARDLATTVARQCEQAVVRARLYVAADEASRAKDQFLAMLGHELRNPLAPILTALQLMKMRGAKENARERAMIERQAGHLVRLVDDLLDISRITRGNVGLKKRAMSLGDVVADAVETASPLLEERGHHLTVDVPIEKVVVDGDPDRLSQVVANLLTNAARYTPAGGHIAVRLSRDDGMAVLSVKDDGVGIAPALLPRVFDLFVQGDQKLDRAGGGLGIGLALVRRLVELHGGAVALKSEGTDRGTEATLRLPLALATPAAGSTATEPAPKRNAVRALVVDDNPDAADSLAELLKVAGCVVDVANDGPSALALAAAHPPQLALLDLGLPVMDGFELAARLVEQAPSRPPRLVAVTGYGQPSDIARSREAGFRDHLVKPIDFAALTRILAEVTPTASTAASEAGAPS